MRTPHAGPSQWRVDAALVLIALVWGVTFVMVKQALDNISTLLFLTLRFTFAALALAVLFQSKARTEIRAGNNLRISLQSGALAGVCLFSGYVLQTFGLKYTTPAKAGFLTGLYIPLVPVFSALLYRKLPRLAEGAGVAFAFTGMALMTIQGSLSSINFGDVLVSGCAVAYALHILVLGRFAQAASVAVLTIVQIGTSALLGALTFWWAEPPRLRNTNGVWLALAVTSLLATALAFSLQTWAQQYSSPTRTALIFSMEPVFAWITSYLVSGEIFDTRTVAGAALILGGILLVELKPAAVRQHPSP